MMLLFKSEAVFDAVVADTPQIGEVLIGTPLVGADGRHLICHPWADEDMAEFEAYWQDFFADGRLAWGESLPEDWEAMGDEE